MRSQPILGVAMFPVGSVPLTGRAANDAAVDQSPTRSTRLYVRTVPKGAHITLNGKPRGTSPHLFVVPRDATRMTVEVEPDGHDAEQRVVEIVGGRIARVEFVLRKPAPPPGSAAAPPGVADTEAKRPPAPPRDAGGGRPDWGPGQATGAPDTPRADDLPTAWASLSPDGQPEWLLLRYARPIKAMAVAVHETYNPGALRRVCVFDSEGKEVEAWRGNDPTAPGTGKGVSRIPLKVDFPVSDVKLYLDSPAVQGWNEIDAVGLVDERGRIHWAQSAEASSSYAERASGGGDDDDPFATAAQPAAPFQPPAGAIALSHVDDASTDKRSLGGTGEAVVFERPEGAKYVTAVQIYASRYGYPQPPDEDFHVYLLDQDQRVIKTLAFPYAMIHRAPLRWYSLRVPAVEVPRRFFVALSFNAHRTKGVYVGIDRTVAQSHSYIGLPDSGFKPITDGYDWMVRACVVSADGTARPTDSAAGVRP